MKPTKALIKISRLKKRIKAIRGGQGAGKTFSILILIINYASSNEDKEIYIASKELTKMRQTVIKDFVKILKMFNIYSDKDFLAGTHYRFPNGSFIKFIGLDKADIGKGLRSDLVYVNEANKIDFETYRELTSRAKQIIIDWNPNAEYWADTEVIPRSDCDFLNLTFKDNCYLSKEERTEILSYYEKGYDENGNEINSYWANKWRVYGLGEIGIIEGAIYQNWKIGEFDDNLPFGYCMDFGYKDPFTVTKIAFDLKNNLTYLQEVIYQSFLSSKEIVEIMESRGIDKSKPIIADSADPTMIKLIKNEGYNIYPAVKDKVINGIRQLQNFEMIVEKDSFNIQNELRNYIWLDKHGEIPIDDYNHVLDAVRYYEKFYTFKYA